MTWLFTRIGRYLAAIGAALAVVAGAVLFGWRKRRQAEAGRAAKDHIETRKRVDAESYIDADIAAARERMRKRGQR